jgi:F420-dependent oxidoreductase-like protein
VRTGVFLPTVEHGEVDAVVGRTRELAAAGLASVWVPQSAGFDALTLLAVVGREVGGIELGTAVVPTFPRHPVMLAAQALTTNAATGGRLCLGVGLSHRPLIEGRFGLSFDRPARHMREYLEVLLPLLREGEVDVTGEVLSGHGEVAVAGGGSPPVLLAALQPRMLELAGALADGTITWCTGPVTLEEQVVPGVVRAAEAAGRPSPRIVVVLPMLLTAGDPAEGRALADRLLVGHADLPSYRAVLDHEGAAGPGDVALVGDEGALRAGLARLADLGATDFVAIPVGTPDERARTVQLLAATP